MLLWNRGSPHARSKNIFLDIRAENPTQANTNRRLEWATRFFYPYGLRYLTPLFGSHTPCSLRT